MPVAPGLWPHQVEAVTAIDTTIARGGRTSLIMACGTGKTRIGGAVASNLGTRRRALVVLPTIELLVQTLESYRAATDKSLGTVVAVCSDSTIAELEMLAGEPDVVVTTNTAELADAVAGRGRVTVLSTYASLPVIAAAHAHHDLAKWDLVVVDEAHRTTGKADGPWKVVHHDARIPARRRLYMTATPRVSTSADEAVVSMDDHAIFGEVSYRLPFSRAINMGLLADYRVVVPVITSEEIHQLIRDQGLAMRLGGSEVAPGVLAGQIAVLRSMTEYGVRRAISYHHRVADAKVWAHTLPATAALMPGGAIDLWAGHVSGAQPPHLRRRILERLASSEDETVVISNARVLNEGVDVPAVDAVVFSRPRESAIDTIQALGRALRTGGRTDKIATVVVPLLLAEGESPEAALEGSEWEPVWQVLRALRDHDDRLDEALKVQRAKLGQGTLFDITTREVKLPPWLHVQGVDVPDSFARAVTIRAVRASTPSWEEFYGAAVAYRDVQGNVEIPVDWVTAEGLRLGDWWRRQKVAFNAATLEPDRTERLEQLGIIWDTLTEQWSRTYGDLRAYVEGGGDLLDIPDDLLAPSTGVVLTNWCAQQRARRAIGKVSEDRIALLNEIGFIWDPAEARWMRRYHELKAIHDDRGTLLRLPAGSREAVWLENQIVNARRGNGLSKEKIALLAGLGIDVLADRTRQLWLRTFEELKAFHAEEGHWTVPDDMRTLDDVRLRAWQSTQRKSKASGSLAPDLIAMLDRIGFPWDPRTEKGSAVIDARIEELTAFYVANGHLALPKPGPLKSWLYQQRKKARQQTLSKEVATRLAGIDPLWFDERGSLASDRTRANLALTDESWAQIKPLLPPLRTSGSGSIAWNKADHRTVVEGMVWKLRTGMPWDTLPKECGSYQTVSSWWLQWKEEGRWAQIEAVVQVRGAMAPA